MKKLIAAAAVTAVAAIGFGVSSPTDAKGGQPKETVCHDGDHGIEAISIAAPAVEKHIAHGDFRPGDPVPGYGGYGATFGDDCQPVPNPVPDSDGDGVADDVDQCPAEGDLGGGVDSIGCPIPVDSDGDGVPDEFDECPGSDDYIDQDSDGIPNGCDPCPTYPGQDGCLDFDGDGVINADDYCPFEGDQGYGLEGDGCPVPPPPPSVDPALQLEGLCSTYGGQWSAEVDAGGSATLFVDTTYRCDAPTVDSPTFAPLWENACKAGNWVRYGFWPLAPAYYACTLRT